MAHIIILLDNAGLDYSAKCTVQGHPIIGGRSAFMAPNLVLPHSTIFTSLIYMET